MTSLFDLAPAKELQLWPYQQELKDRVLAALNRGSRVMMQLPTGGGKTVLGLGIIKEVVDNGGRVLVLAHRVELIDQLVTQSTKYGLPTRNVYVGEPYTFEGVHVQSIGKVHQVPDSWRPRLVVIDEAHHATARTWARVVKKYHSQGAMVLGMTATPWRMSKLEGYDHLFDELVVGPQTLKLIQDGYLAMPLVVHSRQNKIRGINGDVATSGGDYSAGRMQKRLGPSLVQIPVEEWQEWCQSKRTIIYTVTRRIALDVAARIQELGGRVGVLYSPSLSDAEDQNWLALKEAALASGVMIGTAADREAVISGFATGHLNVVTNVEVLTEGVDFPEANAVILARPTKSLTLQRQMIGRVLRVTDGKSDALVIDAAGTLDEPTVGHPLTDVVWTLAPRGQPEDGVAPVSSCDQCGNVNPAAAHDCLHCGHPMGLWCLRCRQWRSSFWEGVNKDYLESDVRTGAELAQAYHVLKTIKICPRCIEDLRLIEESRREQEKRQAQHPLKCPKCGGAKLPKYDYCRRCGMNTCPKCPRQKQIKYALCWPCSQKQEASRPRIPVR